MVTFDLNIIIKILVTFLVFKIDDSRLAYFDYGSTCHKKGLRLEILKVQLTFLIKGPHK